MLFIGEKINSSIRKVAAAIESKDSAFIKKLATDQVEAGADMLDVNAGIFLDREPEFLGWLVQTIQEAVDVPLCIDSPSPEALRVALSLHRGKALVNSISLENDRYTSIVPLVKEFGSSVVALCMDERGIPHNAATRIDIACQLAERLESDTIPTDDIIFDVLVQPISVDNTFGLVALDTVRGINGRIPGAHLTCGLSNVSFGLPERKLLNSTFAAILLSSGMDTFIIDPLDSMIMAILIASKALTARDEFCEDYLKAFRSGRLKLHP
ncbi:MAG: dihydropteroate synthase [Desulfomonilaceae bacterium]